MGRPFRNVYLKATLSSLFMAVRVRNGYVSCINEVRYPTYLSRHPEQVRPHEDLLEKRDHLQDIANQEVSQSAWRLSI